MEKNSLSSAGYLARSYCPERTTARRVPKVLSQSAKVAVWGVGLWWSSTGYFGGLDPDSQSDKAEWPQTEDLSDAEREETLCQNPIPHIVMIGPPSRTRPCLSFPAYQSPGLSCRLRLPGNDPSHLGWISEVEASARSPAGRAAPRANLPCSP